tara:strand:+ start:73 stop:558 length:486 start_codon:yes stop_codon:yes gene_type:complete
LKQLFIIRHGKSDWGNPFQDDFDRPLNHRGLIDAKKMGSYLSNYTHPQKIISSTAKRAITTAYLIGDQLKINQHEIEQQKKLYHAPLDKLLETIQTADNKHNTLYIVGHNPGLSSLVSYLSEDWIELKTCCVAILQADVDSWSNWIKGVATLKQYISPKTI